MSNRRSLILLADKLDRAGMTKEASIVDETIEKNTFDEETRGDIRDLIPEMERILTELDRAVEIGLPGVGGVKGFVGGLEGEQKEFYQDRLRRLREMTEYVSELNGVMQGEWEDDSAPDQPEGGQEEVPADETESSGGSEWWKFWKKDDEGASSGTDSDDTGVEQEDRVTLEIGEDHIINLDENPSTGYTWSVISPTSDEILSWESAFEAGGSDAVGSGGTRSYTFTANSPGTERIELRYSRPGTDATDGEVFRQMIVVSQPFSDEAPEREFSPEQELDEQAPDEQGDSGDRFKRTRIPGVNVEQSISNVGNVTIGE